MLTLHEHLHNYLGSVSHISKVLDKMKVMWRTELHFLGCNNTLQKNKGCGKYIFS